MYPVAMRKDLLSYCISRAFHSTVSIDLSNLVPSTLGMVNPVETFTSMNNLYVYYYVCVACESMHCICT